VLTPRNGPGSGGAEEGSDPRAPTDFSIQRGIGLLPSSLSHSKHIRGKGVRA